MKLKKGTGNAFRPDLLLLIAKDNVLYILQLTIGFETNIQVNSEIKASKYHHLQQTLLPNYKQIKFINLSLGALGTIRSSSESFVALLNLVVFGKICPSAISCASILKSLGLGDKLHKHILSNLINITNRGTYYIFCC